jgi:hypothetical protein
MSRMPNKCDSPTGNIGTAKDELTLEGTNVRKDTDSKKLNYKLNIINLMNELLLLWA